MGNLHVTLIDVGWGDSILLTWEDQGECHYGLIDCNDSAHLRSSHIFLNRYLKKLKVDMNAKHIFDFVILSHAHSDHGLGLQRIMSTFGTKYFLYPKSLELGSLASLMRFARNSDDVLHYESINCKDTEKAFRLFSSEVKFKVLWPKPNHVFRLDDENNNSIVLSVTFDKVTILLTGDAEGKVWEKIATDIPDTTRVFKVPHHGSRNGTIWKSKTPWLDSCPNNDVLLAISSDGLRHGHPHQEVTDAFEAKNFTYYRTDEHYHLTFSTDGDDVEVKYSHV
jgi:beta-lactamase superfamily II metal-dependent hydrolase